MARMRALGNASLITAIAGSAVCAGLVHAGWHGVAATIISAGFEAAVIGGVADWFAVTALFHRVPIPLVERHTAIVVRNRARIATALADLVQHRWLSRGAIAARLAAMAPAGALLDWLAAPARRERIGGAARDAAADLAAGLDRASMTRAVAAALRAHVVTIDPGATLGRWLAAALAKGDQQALWTTLANGLTAALDHPAARNATAGILREAFAEWLPRALEDARGGPVPGIAAAALRRTLSDLDLARPLGAWLLTALAHGDHDRLAAALCNGLRRELAASPGMRATIARTAATAARKYAEGGWGRGAVRRWLEWTGTLDYDDIATEVSSALDRELAAAAGDPAHPLRVELDNAVRAWAKRLADGDPAAVVAIDELRRRLLETLDLSGLVQTLLAGLAADLRQHQMKPAVGAGGDPAAKVVAITAAVGTHPLLDLIDPQAMAASLLSALSSTVGKAATDPDHPLRREGDAALATLAARLTDGDGATAAAATDLLRRVVAALDLDSALLPVVAGVQAAAVTALRDPGSTPSRHLLSALGNALDTIQRDPIARRRLDRRLRLELRGLVARHHDLIGEVVRHSLSPERLPDAALVRELETQIGDDLQYIRLNGAIVGAMVGAVLAALKML